MAKQTQASLMAALTALVAQANAAAAAPADTAAPEATATAAQVNFLRGRRVAAPAVKAPKVKDAPGIRAYTLTESKVSEYGHPFLVFTAATKNGGTMTRLVPADLAAMIRTGAFDKDIKAALDSAYGQ